MIIDLKVKEKDIHIIHNEPVNALYFYKFNFGNSYLLMRV